MIDQILNCEDGFKIPDFGALNWGDLLAKTFDVNVVGTANILELIAQHESVKVGIFATTDKVYQNLELDSLKEKLPFSQKEISKTAYLNFTTGDSVGKL